jgi:hypothetical protein
MVTEPRDIRECPRYVDGSAIEFVHSLKMMVGEDDSPQYWKEQLEQCREFDMNAADFMTIVPVNFSTEGRNMLWHVKELLEYRPRQLIGINSKFEKLILSLRTVVWDNSGRLDKNQTVSDDVRDAAMLALKHFRIKKPQGNEQPIILFK